MATNYQYIRRSGKPQKTELFQLDLELTERCNNNCIHCCINLPANDKEALQDELSYQEIKEALQEASDLGCYNVRFTGGEPVLRQDFEQIYLFACKLGMRVAIYTNARLITPQLAQLFSRVRPMKVVEVSVYGMHEDSYEINTQSTGSYQSFMRGVQSLEEYQVPYIIKSALLPASKNEMDELKKWAEENQWMDDMPPSITKFFDLRNRGDDPQKDLRIKSLRPSPKDAVKFIEAYNKGFDEIKENYWKEMRRLPGDKLFGCNAGEHQITIDAYGNIQPCLAMRNPALIQPKGTSLKNALDAFKKLREMKATNPDYMERCARCFLRNLCNQCPAKAWTETGTLDTPVQYLCDVTHAMARHLGWLDESEVSWEVQNWKARIRLN